MNSNSHRDLFYEIAPDGQISRLDVYLSSVSVGLSRSRIQALIKSGNIKVNNSCSKASYILKQGDKISISLPPPSEDNLRPEPVIFGIVHEDNSIIVVNKPAGIVVHPAPGHSAGTLVHGLLHHCKDLSGIGGVIRPGIVHRLDKDTSGIMVVAKNDYAHDFLARQFKSGSIKKDYIALVHGIVKANEGEIDLPVGRNPVKRKEMSVRLKQGRNAVTLWRRIDVFKCGFSLLAVSLKTGRTHQIRVHMSHIGHPVAGDRVYGYGINWWKNNQTFNKGIRPSINRQMLHSRRLGFIHPERNIPVEFEVPVPEDINSALADLRHIDLLHNK
ncbi:MAG: RluA family pseudouridine synthase [Deltaproteobacteria bacterium]|nr:RluA family pseudouridine synthase [Deltaproteobacteria bacterium]